MVNYYVYAKDFSGSTDGQAFFHTNGLKTLEEFKNDVNKIEQQLLKENDETKSKIVYLHWGDKCWEVSEDETRAKYLSKSSGWMGTEPEEIINCLRKHYILHRNDRIKLLYIITDGLIDANSAEACFLLNEDMHYEKVVFHAFNLNLDDIDLSVAASFLKGHCVVYRNYELFGNTDVSKEYNYDKININNFAAEQDELLSYIRFKYIRTVKQDVGALREIDKLKKLRNRLFDEISSKSENRGDINLETKDRNVFQQEFVRTEWYKNLYGAEYVDKVYIEKSISTLINYIVSESKSYSFDALKFHKNFVESVPEEEIVDLHFSAEQEIEFPDIILDDDKGIPVVILTKLNLLNKIIFRGMEQPAGDVSPARFSKFKSIMECPLFLVKDADISESIGYFYTLNVYKKFLDTKFNTEPRTRRPFHGGIVLTDTDQFDKYNDYILSATYFESKKVYFNVGLFYYILWKNCENKEWMDKNVVEQFKKYTMRRISETVCKIALSSLPLDPPVKTSLPTALWYCTELSSWIFKNDPQNFNQERLRMYHGVAPYMIEILEHFNYILDLETIEKRRDLISHVAILKKIPKYRERVYYLLEKIFKTVDGFLVGQIENPSNLNKLSYLILDHKQMLPDNVIDEEVHLNNYVHLMHMQGDVDGPKITSFGNLEICPKTYRPFFTINSNKSFYGELIKTTKKIVIKNDYDQDKIEIAYEPIDTLEFDKTLSLYKLFINCVEDLEKYPTLDEYVQYVSNKKKFNEDLVTIFPINVYTDIKDVYETYQQVVANVDVKNFIAASGTYVNRNNRIKAEERVKFNNDEEINEFIAKEELKANFKKKTK